MGTMRKNCESWDGLRRVVVVEGDRWVVVTVVIDTMHRAKVLGRGRGGRGIGVVGV